jgi:hypothetical protein
VVDEPRPVVPCVVDEPRPVVPWVVLEWLPVRSLAPTLPSLLRSRGFEVPVWVVEVCWPWVPEVPRPLLTPEL